MECQSTDGDCCNKRDKMDNRTVECVWGKQMNNIADRKKEKYGKDVCEITKNTRHPLHNTLLLLDRIG